MHLFGVLDVEVSGVLGCGLEVLLLHCVFFWLCLLGVVFLAVLAWGKVNCSSGGICVIWFCVL